MARMQDFAQFTPEFLGVSGPQLPCRKATSSRLAGSVLDPACISFIASYAPASPWIVGNNTGAGQHSPKTDYAQ